MKVLFALVLFSHLYNGEILESRVGLYEHYGSCQAQKAAIEKTLDYWYTEREAKTRNWGEPTVYPILCLPVNQ